ncbi:MAG: flavodoxin domain-containing protein [Rhodospirillales bacterium]
MSAKILIAFYSRTGSTEALAKAVAEGAEAQGAEVRLRRVRGIRRARRDGAGARLAGACGADERGF